ncbi:MAG: amino acid ABC transporter permease [Rhodospirillaceae bacterium]|nr:amino acid ABC transporter permease [Rhodospirillaceae bacterium]
MMEPLQFVWDEVVPILNQGIWMSLKLIVPSVGFGLLLGIILGAARTYGPPWLRRTGDGFVAVFRGTPLVCQLFVLYFGLPNIGIYLEPYAAAVLGFTLCTASYQSEYIRGGLKATRRGQFLAAQALGFSTLQSLIWVVVPQAVRRALPGIGNEVIYLIKYSSLAYVVTCVELTGQGKIIASQTFRFTEVFLVVGLYYLALVSVATLVLKRVERKLTIPGFGAV